MLKRHGMNMGALALAALVAGACSDGFGSGETESVNVTMQQTSGASAHVVGGFLASAAGGSGSAVAIARDQVASLEVLVTDIQFLPKAQENEANDDGAWISLNLASPVALDLMALPTEAESPLVIAGGSVPLGSYGDVRLFVSSASVIFAEAVDLGVAFSFEAGVEYAVDIPSGDQTGIKTDAEFTVEADLEGNANDVALLFDPEATLLNVTGTAQGEVILTPVLRGRQ